MKAIRLAFLLVLTASPAAAVEPTQKVNLRTINLRTITCKQAIALPADTLDLVSVWLDGFMSDDDDPTSMVIDFSDLDADEIRAFCQKNPRTRLLQAVEDLDEQSSDDD